MNEFFNAGPSFNTESTPCRPVSRPVGVSLAGYATLQLRPGRRLAKVPLKDPLPAWQRIFERQKSQNGRQPISK